MKGKKRNKLDFWGYFKFILNIFSWLLEDMVGFYLGCNIFFIYIENLLYLLVWLVNVGRLN